MIPKDIIPATTAYARTPVKSALIKRIAYKITQNNQIDYEITQNNQIDYEITQNNQIDLK